MITATVERLESAGLLDDEKFAENFVRYRLGSRPEGRMMLASRLMARGVKRDLAETAVERAVPDEKEAALAAEAARRFLARRAGAARASPDARRRLANHLARRGFRTSVVAKIVSGRFPSAGYQDED